MIETREMQLLREKVGEAGRLASVGKNAAAIQLLEQVLDATPNDSVLLLMLATLYLAERSYTPARKLVFRVLRGPLASPKVALKLFSLLAQLGETKIMVEIARQLPPSMWDSAKSLSEVAQSLSTTNANELVREYALEGVRRDPDHPPSLYMLATIEVFFGNFKEAEKCIRRCLDLVPGDPGSYWLLSRLRLPDGESRVRELDALLVKEAQPANRSWLAYALHNELHDLKQYEKSWFALEQGCNAKRSLLDYDTNSNAFLYQSLRSWREEECRLQDGYADPELTPIFVVGLHRSGTTLAERIISGHSRVSAGGETYDITTQLRRESGYYFPSEVDLRVIERRAELNYRRIGEGYLKGIRWRSNGRSYITDKLPSNFQNIGFIARALPNAKFIHLVRDPIDVGFSNLRTLFNFACPYSYNQMEIVEHYHRYNALMQHWNNLVPERILNVNYSELVDSPTKTAERITNFIGIPFEPEMVEIESRTDSVSTASSVMMRDGIRKDRSAVWRNYEPWLMPLISGLQASK